MSFEINAAHMLVIVISIASWVFWLPWFMAIPMALVLLLAVTKVTSLIESIGEPEE